MANADRKSFGAGQQDQGKGDGTGGMSPADIDTPLPSEVLSNRDTSQHSDQRGLDSSFVQTQQLHDHVGNQSSDQDTAGDTPDRDKLADERPTDKPEDTA